MATKNLTTTNLAPNIASALCYVPVVGWVAALVLVIIEKQETIRWNAFQSLLLTGAVLVLDLALVTTIILVWAVPLVNIAVLVLDLILAVKSYQGETMRLPLISNWVDKIVKKV